jgi:hypothetical protein
MSGAEILERSRQQIDKRVDLLRYRLHAGPSVKISHGASQPRFFFSPEQLPELTALLRRRMPEEVDRIITRAGKICAHRFDLLGYKNLDYGMKIDWHLDRVHTKRSPQKPWYQIRYLEFAEAGDVKVTWELNRHQHLVTLAKAFVISKDKRFVRELTAQWYDWTEQNPYPLGVNWASSLEVAFRALSWLWVRHLLTGSLTTKFENDLTKALAVSGRHIERYLSTFFSPNTHLLGEGVGLFFLGVLCPELSSANRWRRLGWKIVLEESERQVFPDGMHFEQSAYYHVYALDFFLHAALLAARNDIQLPQHFERTLEKMLDALLLISQAGIVARFGDDDGGRVFDGTRNGGEHLLDPLATGAVLFGRSDFKTAAGNLREETVWLLGTEGVARFDEIASSANAVRSAALADSGLYVMASQQPEATQLLIDAGPQGAHSAGHGHAEALSIQLAKSGHMLLLDPGTGEYIGSGSTRKDFRGTDAHNTLQVDGQSQSAPLGPFSWDRLTKTVVQTWVQGQHFDLFAGSHDGYAPTVHRRWVFYRKPDFWLVRDLVEGAGKHRCDIHWHFAPGTVQGKGTSRVFVPAAGSSGLAVITPASGWEVKLSEGKWSPAYGQGEPAPVLQFSRDAVLPVETATVLVPTQTGKARGEVAEIGKPDESEASGYKYFRADETHRMFFSHAAQWSLDDWSSDAEFLYVGEHRNSITEIIFCNGSRVAFRGRPIVSAGRRIESCELIRATSEILSDQKDLITLHGWPEIGTPLSDRSPEPVTTRSGS